MIRNRFLFLLWGKDMVTTQLFPSHTEAMTFSNAVRSGTVVDAPTPSFFFQSWSPTKLHLFVCVSPFFPHTAFREECSPSKAVLNYLVSVTSLLTNYFKNHKRWILLLVGRFFVCLWVLEAFWFGFGFFKTKRIIKPCTCTQQWSFASSGQVLAIVTLAMVSASIHSSTASSTL